MREKNDDIEMPERCYHYYFIKEKNIIRVFNNSNHKTIETFLIKATGNKPILKKNNRIWKEYWVDPSMFHCLAVAMRLKYRKHSLL